MDVVTTAYSQNITISDDDVNAISLQMEEIQLQRDSRKEKYLEGGAPDREVAIRDFEIELGRFLLFLSDQKLARSIERAIDDDATALREVITEEARARSDRAMALRISGEGSEAENVEDLNGVVEGIRNTWALESMLSTSPVNESDDEGFAGPSASCAQHEAPRARSPYMVDCVACGDVFPLSGLIRCPCGHLYCPECLRSLFVRATTDETLFPPRCCSQIIPLSAIEAELSNEALSGFNSAAIEFNTTNRTYCVRPDCGKFIPPSQIHSGRAVCPNCSSETCAYCKMIIHSGDCPEDQALRALLALAEGERWRRCFSCNTMVELRTGCNHITCKCSAQFCYTCGVQWKNCTCDIWEERNLLHRAEQVVDREADRPMAAAERHRRVVEVRRELQANHECNHPGRWERQEGYRRKGYRCEICDTRHWKYILRCRHCHLVACEECRRHRV